MIDRQPLEAFAEKKCCLSLLHLAHVNQLILFSIVGGHDVGEARLSPF